MSSAQSMRFRSRWRTADHRLAMGARISTVPEERRGCECSTTFGYDRSSACGAGDRPSWDGGGGLRSSGLPNPATLPSARQTKKTLMMATAPRKLTSPRLPLQVVPAHASVLSHQQKGGGQRQGQSHAVPTPRAARRLSPTRRAIGLASPPLRCRQQRRPAYSISRRRIGVADGADAGTRARGCRGTRDERP